MFCVVLCSLCFDVVYVFIIDRMDYSFLKICIFYTSVPGADSAPDLCSIFSQTSVFLDIRHLHKCA